MISHGFRVSILLNHYAVFRPGSHVSDMTPDPSVDVSDWNVTNDLHTDTPVTAELD